MTDAPTRPDDDFFARPKTARFIFVVLGLLCVVLALLDLAHEKHAHFPHEGWFAFSGLFGFVAYVTIVYTAKGLRRLVRRPEDYYDD